MLVVGSVVFDVMFNGGMVIMFIEIELFDVEFVVFLVLFKFFYLDEV